MRRGARSLKKPMSDAAPPLGPHILQIRKSRRLTLEQLAAASGVSRSMLSQIERGEANPTFATLWNLTRALNIDISALVGGQATQPDPQIDVIGAHFVPEIRTEDGLCTLRILSPAQSVGRMEWYELRLAPGGVLSSAPHAKGAVEHVSVIEGELEITAGGGTARTGAQGVARYAADAPHTLKNVSDGQTRAFLVVIG
jgi:transcriptional regulator with XRE-family HTH domain